MILGITRRKIAAYKSRFMRGSSYLGIFLLLITCAGQLRLMGLQYSFIIIAVIGAIAYFGGCYAVGYFDELRGIWKEENEYTSFTVVKMNQENYDRINYIYEKLGGKGE